MKIDNRIHHAALKIKTGASVEGSNKTYAVTLNKGNARSLKSGVTYKSISESDEEQQRVDRNRDKHRDSNFADSGKDGVNGISSAAAHKGASRNVGAQISLSASNSAKRVRLSRGGISGKRGILNKSRMKLQSGLKSVNDTGGDSISQTIDAVVTGAKVYKGARAVTGLTVKTGVLAVKTPSKIKRFISNRGSAKVVRYKYSLSKKTAVRTNSGTVKTGSRIIESIRSGSSAAAKNTKKSYSLSVKDLNAKTAEKFARMHAAYKKEEASAFISEAIAKANRISELKRAGKISLKIGVKTLKTGSKAIKTGVLYSSDYALGTLEYSPDLGTQTFAVGVKGVKHTVKGVAGAPKAIKKGFRAVKSAVIFPVKTSVAVYEEGKRIMYAVKKLRRRVAKKTTLHLNQQLFRASGQAARATAKAAGRLLLSLTNKVALPLFLIIAISSAVSSVASSGVTLLTAIFGETFSIKGQNEDLDVREYLREVVELKKNRLITEVSSLERNNLVPVGNYHEVRLFADNDAGQVDFSAAGILQTINSTEDFIAIMSPAFKTIIFADYDLEPTQEALDALINDMWNVLVKIQTEDLPVEYCSTEVDEETGIVSHPAYDDCPNRDRNRPHLCDGHKILSVTVIQGGYFELANEFFMNELTTLKGLLFRNEHQEERLSELEGMYELYLVYMQEEVANFGGLPDFSGIPPDALEDETFAILMEEATKYLGFPYVWGGSTPATSFDCSGFVFWVYTTSGVYPHGRTTAYALSIITQPVTPSEAKPGDLVFFADSTATLERPITHVGIYIGDGKMIHSGASSGVSYANITTSYWQSIFYSFGRFNITNTAEYS